MQLLLAVIDNLKVAWQLMGYLIAMFHPKG